jgi:hypothetical protein
MTFWIIAGAVALVYFGFVLGWAYYGGTIAELRSKLAAIALVDEATEEVKSGTA